MPRPCTPVVTAVCAVATTLAAPAWAGGFAEDGTYVPDPAAVSVIGFEPGEVEGAAGAEVGPVEAPLEGVAALTLGQFTGFDVDLPVPPGARRYRASAWVRGGDVVADVEVFKADAQFGVDTIVQLFPTGRVTSDDWIELSGEVRIVDDPTVRIGFFAARGGLVDAVEIVPIGDLTPAELGTDGPGTSGLGSACDGAVDGSGCPTGAVCTYGACRDVSGLVPPLPENHAEVAEYLAARLEIIFGPFINRELDLPNARIAIEQMRGATDGWTFWNGFGLAVRRLHDGHTSTGTIGDFVLRNERPLGLCFLEGDADLSHDAAPKDDAYLDVLVSHTGPERTLGLARGDRLVAIDGVHPIEWARGLVGFHWSLSPTSNHETFAELAEQLRSLISRYAETLQVVRCDAGAGTCGEVETLFLDEVAPRLPFDAPFQGVACDNRPLRHLPLSPADHATGDAVYAGRLLGTAFEERLYGMEWESLYTSNGTDGVGGPFKDAVATWKQVGARGVMLDHRSGNGGTLAAPSILWNHFVQRRASDAYVDRQRAEDERPTLEEGLEIFARAQARGQVNFVGTPAPDGADTKVALLLTRDVSASDWLPLGFKGSPNTRIFAPFETNGAFSTRYMLGYWLGLRYVLASGDTFLPNGATQNGLGVKPDVVVLPLQSDLIADRDTVFEVALAWLRDDGGGAGGGSGVGGGGGGQGGSGQGGSGQGGSGQGGSGQGGSGQGGGGSPGVGGGASVASAGGAP